jgi:hypothetical protein
MILCWPVGFCPGAQEGADPAPPVTLEKRMQRSVSRQANSVARMERSTSLQRLAAQRRQTGQDSDESFFTLPAPAPLITPLPPEPGDSDASEVSGGINPEDQMDSDEPGPPEPPSQVPAPNSSARIDPPRKQASPLAIAMPLTAIAGIGGIDPLVDSGIFDSGVIEAGGSSLEGMVLRQLAGAEKVAPGGSAALDGFQKLNTSGTNSILRSTGPFDYLRQILAIGADGNSLLPVISGDR